MKVWCKCVTEAEKDEVRMYNRDRYKNLSADQKNVLTAKARDAYKVLSEDSKNRKRRLAREARTKRILLLTEDQKAELRRRARESVAKSTPEQREKVRARARLYNPVYARKTCYGLDQATFDAMFKEQNGRCAICGVELVQSGRGSNRLHVDHNHKTKKVRALLCHVHNTGLGMFQERPETLEAAAAYLRRHQ